MRGEKVDETGRMPQTTTTAIERSAEPGERADAEEQDPTISRNSARRWGRSSESRRPQQTSRGVAWGCFGVPRGWYRAPNCSSIKFTIDTYLGTYLSTMCGLMTCYRLIQTLLTPFQSLCQA